MRWRPLPGNRLQRRVHGLFFVWWSAPRDAPAAVQALAQIADGAKVREGLIDRGLKLARRHTLESETARVAAFIASPNGAGPTGA